LGFWAYLSKPERKKKRWGGRIIGGEKEKRIILLRQYPMAPAVREELFVNWTSGESPGGREGGAAVQLLFHRRGRGGP